MAMLTAYFGLNVTLNYSWLHISMLKGSLVEKNSKFFIKKQNLSCCLKPKKVPKTTVPSNLCVSNQKGILLQKPN